MHPRAVFDQALVLIDQGLNDTEISRVTGIHRRTIGDWRRAQASGVLGSMRSRSKTWARDQPGKRCRGCQPPIHDPEAYAYLLGAYLGDGWISSHPRGVFRLRVSCALAYPEIIDEIATCIAIVRGSDRIGFGAAPGCVQVGAFWKHWPCVLPQHGAGRKHDRLIELTDWQRSIVEPQTKALLRGLVHSDGSRHINTVTRQLKEGPRRYAYSRYMFTNASTDILGIFTDGLDHLGIHWTRTSPRDISVARRADVAMLDTFIGPKE